MGLKYAIRRNALFLAAACTSRRPVIFYAAGWLGFDNLGDEALLAADRLLFPGHRLVGFGEEIRDAAARRVRRPRTALLAGGTLINGRRQWLATFDRCARLCERSFVFGSGVEDPAFWRGRPGWTDDRADWRPVLERCRYVGVRGPRSVQLLDEVGLRDVEMIGDPVLALARPVPGAADAAPAGVGSSGILGLNIGQSGGRQWGDEDALRREYVELARQAHRLGWRVEWYVVWPDDLPLTEEVAARSGTAETIRRVYRDPQIFLDSVGRCDYFLGLKLHAVVLATCAWVPSLMVEYRPKCRDFMASIGREEATVRSDRLRAGSVLERLEDWQRDRAGEVRRLVAGVRPLVERQRRRAEQVATQIR